MSVRITIEIPDEIATQLAANGQELSRAVLEALALEEFRLGTLNQRQVGHLSGFTRMETEDFLAEHADLYDFDPSQLRREAEFLAKLPETPNMLVVSPSTLSEIKTVCAECVWPHSWPN